jgi:general secretion pathway protein J
MLKTIDLLKGSRGFTLLELLIALSLLALMALYLSAGIGTGRRVWETRASIEDRETLTAVREFLRQRIEETWPAHKRLASDEIRLVFDGSEDRLEFVSPLEAGANWSGLYQFVIRAGGEGQVRNLEIAGDLFRPQEQSTAAKFHRPLLVAVEAIHFAYFGSPSPDSPPVWSSTWPPAQGMPYLVRIKVDFPEGDPRRWSDLIISLRLAQK